MKEIKNKEQAVKDLITPGKEFKGYTIEEIRFQRALVAMEAEFAKAKMSRNWNNIQAANPLVPGNKTSLSGKAGSLALKMINGLNYIDFILLGLSVFKGSKKIMSFLRRRKK